ncbi:MAG TPA: hypothetical protein VHZ06_07290 [Marmoricola sp.]|jgi:hypothetical protein|nr:hypothetical protein [Marmoricola sp.]
MTDLSLESADDDFSDDLSDDLSDDVAEPDLDASDEADEAERARREALLEDTPEEIAARAPGRIETGHPDVDAVIVSLEALDALPVDEHVAVFEQAHEELRRTLSGAGDDR